ncbi:MAG: PDZ domain-containing protein [Chitinophagaceae bacterium]|nr:PDZ domain-containing protein [Chitinophagaceae bacterium]
MKNVMKTIALALIVAAVTNPAEVVAQKGENKAGGEVDQIIITKKGDNKEKIVVEVNGDKILVNGKEYKRDSDSNVTVSRHRIKDVNVYNGAGNRNSVFFKDDKSNQYLALGSMFNENRAMLGVTTEKTANGVEVQEVTKESAAEKIGLKKGDIIKKVDDKKIEESDDLSNIIREKKPGDKVTVTYLRDKKENKVTAELTKWKGVNVFNFSPGMESFRMELGDMNFDEWIPRMSVPRATEAPRVRAYGLVKAGTPKLGLSVQDTEEGKGVKVLETEDDGYGAKAGIKVDDIITEVDGKAVNSTDEIARIMRESKEKSAVKFKVQRKGKTETIDVKIPKKLKTADL